LLNGQLIHYYKNKTSSLNYLVNIEFRFQNIFSDALGFNGYLNTYKNSQHVNVIRHYKHRICAEKNLCEIS